jgi:hypothetical protein
MDHLDGYFGLTFGRALHHQGNMIFGYMACSFVCTYLVYTKIERGKADFSGGIRYLVGFIVLCLGVGTFSIPFMFISGEGTLLGTLSELMVVYGLGAIVVFVLLTLLSWLNDSSPWKELQKCMNLI